MIIALFAAALMLVQPEPPRTIGWADLVPEGEAPAAPPPAAAEHEQFGLQTGSAETVAELDGAYI
ncbi:MAG: hypothetical protein AAGA69_12695, partial [Pseudomonadota bacterium]